MSLLLYRATLERTRWPQIIIDSVGASAGKLNIAFIIAGGNEGK